MGQYLQYIILLELFAVKHYLLESTYKKHDSVVYHQASTTWPLS